MNFKKYYRWFLCDMSVARVKASYYTDALDDYFDTEESALLNLESWMDKYPHFEFRSFILVPVYTKE